MDKPKRKNARFDLWLRHWIAMNKAPLFVVGCYALLWAVQLIPPQVDFFVWQRWALTRFIPGEK